MQDISTLEIEKNFDIKQSSYANELTGSIEGLTKLEIANFSGCTNVSGSIEGLTKLWRANFSGTKVTGDVGKLKKLWRANFSGCANKDLKLGEKELSQCSPEEVFKLKQPTVATCHRQAFLSPVSSY